MATFETSHCKDFGHPEFRFRADGVIRPDVHFLVQALESRVQSGERFSDGETVQLGWSVLLVRENPDATLSLLEPDFEHMPIRWVKSAAASIQHLRLQKEVCESYFDPAAIDYPSLRQPCLVCTSFPGADPFVMERGATETNDSGWFMSCLDGAHDHNDPSQLMNVSLYEAVLQNSQALPYLALPPGVLLHVAEGKSPQVWFDGETHRPRAGSYMEANEQRSV